MTFKTYAEIPQEVLLALIALLAVKCRPIEAIPCPPDHLAEWNFDAGRRSIVEELIEEQERRVKKTAAETKA